MGFIGKIFGNSQSIGNIGKKSTTSSIDELKSQYPEDTVFIDNGAGADIASKALQKAAREYKEQNKSFVYSEAVFDIWKNEKSSSDEQELAKYAVMTTDPFGSYNTFNQNGQINKAVLSAMASPQPGTVGQTLARIAVEEVPADMHRENTSICQTEALRRIASSENSEPEEQKIAARGLKSRNYDSRERSLREIADLEFRGKDRMSVEERNKLLELGDEWEQTLESDESDDRASLGNTNISRRQNVPPDLEYELFRS
jgi:hypothetical protein